MSKSKSQPATPQPDIAPKAAAKKTPIERPKLRMQELNPFFGAFCLLTAFGAFVSGNPIPGSALTSVGVAFLLYWRDMRPWEEIPRWKRVTVTTLIFIGGAFLVVYIIQQGGF